MAKQETMQQKKGAQVLSQTRELIKQASCNEDEYFKINRYVYARLQQLDEGREKKKKIKTQLFNKNPRCHFCSKEFAGIKGVELHRIDSEKGYNETNCVLSHKECHNDGHKHKDSKNEPIIGKSKIVMQKTITGKHETIRALMEELLLANYDKNSFKPTITYDEIKKIVLSEFPTSKFNKKHLSWYVNKILKNGEFINA